MASARRCRRRSTWGPRPRTRCRRCCGAALSARPRAFCPRARCSTRSTPSRGARACAASRRRRRSGTRGTPSGCRRAARPPRRGNRGSSGRWAARSGSSGGPLRSGNRKTPFRACRARGSGTGGRAPARSSTRGAAAVARADAVAAALPAPEPPVPLAQDRRGFQDAQVGADRFHNDLGQRARVKGFGERGRRPAQPVVRGGGKGGDRLDAVELCGVPRAVPLQPGGLCVGQGRPYPRRARCAAATAARTTRS